MNSGEDRRLQLARHIFNDNVLQELDGAMTKHPRWPIHDECRQALIVGEEAGEFQQAVLNLIEFDDQMDEAANFGGWFTDAMKRKRVDLEKRIEDEAVQVAAMAIRFLIERRFHAQAYGAKSAGEATGSTEAEV